MKALKLTALLLFVMGAVFAQKNNVETASIAINKYISRTDISRTEKTGYLKEAHRYIDKAHENESTSNYYKMWYIRGLVYYCLAVDTNGGLGIKDEPVIKSMNSFLKAKKTDEKGRFEKEIPIYLARATALTYNIGVSSYYLQNKEGFERALRHFQLTLEAIPENDAAMLNKSGVDAGKVKSVAAAVSMQLKKTDLAKEYLTELITMNYADPMIYVNMKSILLEEGDTTGALEVLEKGRRMYEDNQVLLLEELNTYIKLGKQEVLIDRLSKAIELDEYNSQLYYNRGRVFQGKMLKMMEGENKDIAAAQEAQNKSIADYEKAIELYPDYEDALYNLGALYIDIGKIYQEEANSYSYKEKEKVKAANDKAIENYNKALEYLEHAFELNNTNETLKNALLSLYLGLDKMDKYKALKGE